MILHGIPKQGTEDYDFWEKVAKGLGANLDPISLALFFAGGGVGGAVAKKVGVQAAVKIAAKAGAKRAVRTAMKDIAARGIVGSAQFGLHAAGAEGIRQAVAKDADVAKLLREAAIGTLTGAAVGPAAGIPGKGLIGSLPRLAAETGALTGAGAVLSGEKPGAEDFLVNAAVLGASKALARPFERAAVRAGEKIMADEARARQAAGPDAYKELRPGEPVPPPVPDPTQRPSLARPNPAGEVPRPASLVPGATPIGELSPAQKSALWAEAKAAREARRGNLPKPKPPGALRKIIEYEPNTGLGESVGDWFANKIIDENSPFRKFGKAVEKATGGRIKYSADPFYLVRTRFASVPRRAQEYLKANFDHITKGLTEPEIVRLGEHVTARAIDAQRGLHPEAFRELMRDNGLDDGTIHELLRTGAEEIASTGKSMEQMAGEISAFNWKLATDMLGEAKAKELWGEKGFYAPLFSERQATDLDFSLSPDRMLDAQFGVTPGETPLGSPLKRLKGEGSRKLADPFSSIAAQTMGLHRYAAQQEVGRAMAVLAEKFDIPEVAQRAKGPGAGVIEVLHGGERHYYKVDPQVYHAYSNLGKGAKVMFNRLLTTPTKVLRAGATLAPEFWMRNVIRDQFTAMIYSKNGYSPLDFVRGMAEIIGEGEFYKRWVEAGGPSASFAAMDKNHLHRRVVELAKTGKRATIERIVMHPFDALRMFSEMADDATRVGDFRKGVLKGKEDIHAAFESRDITIDFARMGEVGRNVNAIVAFWNAQVGGYEKFNRELGLNAWRTDPKRAGAVAGRAMGLIAIPSALLMLNNLRDERWKDIPDWEKNAFWIIMWPGSKHIWRIPKPFDLGIAFSSPLERFMEAKLKDDPSQYGKLLEAFGSTASDVIPGSPLDITALGPLFEVAKNKSAYTGSRIVPRQLEDWPAELQTKKWTSRTARAFGGAFGYSPAKLEHLWNGYTASLGRYVNDASDTVLNALDPEDAITRPSNEIPFSSVPVLRNIMRGFSVRVGAGQLYDDYVDRLGKNEERWRARKDPRLRMSPRERTEMERVHRVGLRYDRLMSDAWAADRIERSKLLSAEAKREKIDAEYYRINRLAEQALDKIGRR